MFPADPTTSFRLLPTRGKRILQESKYVMTQPPYVEDGNEVRESVYTHPQMGHLRFREIDDRARGAIRVSLHAGDSFIVRTDKPLDVSSFPAGGDTNIRLRPVGGLANTYSLSASNGGMALMSLPGRRNSTFSFSTLWLALRPALLLSQHLQEHTQGAVTATNQLLGFLPGDTLTRPMGVFPQWAWQPADGPLFRRGAGFSDALLQASQTGERVKIAMLDTGIRADHESFATGNTRSPAGIAAALSRGFGQATIGAMNNEFSDPDGHGTHCASVLIGNNPRKNFRGICPDSELIVCRVIQNGAVLEKDACNAIAWAVQQGAKVVSMSWVIPGESTALADLIRANPQTLFVTAPDNKNQDISVQPKFPCCHRMGNLIGVVGASRVGGLASNSDYDPSGNGFAHIAAPAEGICVCSNDGNYASASGTSIAAPHVAGVAAMLYRLLPNARGEEIRDLIVQSAFPDRQLNQDCFSKGRLNAQAAWDAAQQKLRAAPPA